MTVENDTPRNAHARRSDLRMTAHKHDAMIENYEDLIEAGVSTVLAVRQLDVELDTLRNIYSKRDRPFPMVPKPHEDMWTGFLSRKSDGDTL